jgi:hypothetical protein
MMVSLEKIEREIDELLAKDTTYAVCERLSWLYTVRNNLMASDTRDGMKRALTGHLSGSEFVEAASGVDYASLMGVLDEHMAALKVVQPREYAAVLEKIKAL